MNGTKKQQECIYCHKNYEATKEMCRMLGPDSGIYGKFTEDHFTLNLSTNRLFCDDDEYLINTLIKYCPICGRELEVEADD